MKRYPKNGDEARNIIYKLLEHGHIVQAENTNGSFVLFSSITSINNIRGSYISFLDKPPSFCFNSLGIDVYVKGISLFGKIKEISIFKKPIKKYGVGDTVVLLSDNKTYEIERVYEDDLYKLTSLLGSYRGSSIAPHIPPSRKQITIKEIEKELGYDIEIV